MEKIKDIPLNKSYKQSLENAVDTDSYTFSYKNLESLQTKKDVLELKGNDNKSYICGLLATNTTFIAMVAMFDIKDKPTKEGEIFKKHHLKFHISLPETDREKYNLGWDIISKTLMKHNVISSKVIKPGLKMSDDPLQRGRDITIYADANPEKSINHWTDIFVEITLQLINNKVSPGYRPPSTGKKREAYLNGSNYISYRYYNEQKKQSIWPGSDPCEKIIINVKDQPSIPEWQDQKKSVTDLDEIPKLNK